MTVAIAYNQEVALLLTAAIGLIVVLLLGQGLALFVILVAATSTAVLMLRRVRSRVKASLRWLLCRSRRNAYCGGSECSSWTAA